MSVNLASAGAFFESNATLTVPTDWTAFVSFRHAGTSENVGIVGFSSGSLTDSRVLAVRNTDNIQGYYNAWTSTLQAHDLDGWMHGFAQWDNTAGEMKWGVKSDGAGSFNTVTQGSLTAPSYDVAVIGDLVDVGGFEFDGDIAVAKYWDAVLSEADLLTECEGADITTNTGNEWANYQFLDTALTTDSSGNGRTLKSNGTVTYTSDEPAEWSGGGGGATASEVKLAHTRAPFPHALR